MRGRGDREKPEQVMAKRQVYQRHRGHEGFHSRGGSWEERRIRKDKEGCQNAGQCNTADCSTVTLREFGQT